MVADRYKIKKDWGRDCNEGQILGTVAAIYT